MLLRLFVGLQLLAATQAATYGAAPAADKGVHFTEPIKQVWKMGVVVHARGACTGLIATAPLPTDWPEQAIRILAEDLSPQVQRVSYRTLNGGVKQMVVTIPRLRSNETARAIVTLEVAKRNIEPPDDPSVFRVPLRPKRDVSAHLAPSPMIESRHPRIRALAQQITGAAPDAWGKTAAIFDWVRRNVRYEFDPELKGALAALDAGQGDCEELTSLFVALCRASGIPARSVWVPGHCYPEFYLEDDDGKGHWLPGQAAGEARQFAAMTESRPILQKGDSIRVPGIRQPQRYVQVTLTARNCQSSPRIEWVHEEGSRTNQNANSNSVLAP